MERPQFVNGEVYHVYSRGVEKRRIFMNNKDYFRAVHDMFEFNDTAPAQISYHHLHSSIPETRLQKLERKPRKLLVEILCFCLMPNHYHFLLRQLRDGGITEFMRKFGTGFTNYFNIKYDRVGPLFQGKFKAVHVTEQRHLLYLPHYIHLNPLDLYTPEWREKRIKNVAKPLEFLKLYRWSSYPDYIGRTNFPSITQRGFIQEIYGSTDPERYLGDIKEWLSELDLSSIRDLTLE